MGAALSGGKRRKHRKHKKRTRRGDGAYDAPQPAAAAAAAAAAEGRPVTRASVRFALHETRAVDQAEEEVTRFSSLYHAQEQAYTVEHRTTARHSTPVVRVLPSSPPPPPSLALKPTSRNQQPQQAEQLRPSSASFYPQPPSRGGKTPSNAIASSSQPDRQEAPRKGPPPRPPRRDQNGARLSHPPLPPSLPSSPSPASSPPPLPPGRAEELLIRPAIDIRPTPSVRFDKEEKPSPQPQRRVMFRLPLRFDDETQTSGSSPTFSQQHRDLVTRSFESTEWRDYNRHYRHSAKYHDRHSTGESERSRTPQQAQQTQHPEQEGQKPEEQAKEQAAADGVGEEEGFWVQASYSYYPTDFSNELTFSKGDYIWITQRDPSGWWIGRPQKGGRAGALPSNHVMRCA
ncbi:Rho guanine nucleotide exchange factor 6 [Balamuthia mandrillaris]